MNKFKFRIKNYLQAGKFSAAYTFNKIEYPKIIRYLDDKYGAPVFTDHFDDLEHWKVKDKHEWGSANPTNLCTYVKENITIKTGAGSNSLAIKTTPDKATGLDWDGNEMEKVFSSGMVTSKFVIKPWQVVSATMNTSQSYAGSWFAFWLIKKDVEGDSRYREIDIFEKFMEKKSQKQYTISIHGGTQNSREMMNFQYPMFFVNEEKLTFTCELYPDKVKIFVNGIYLFLAEEPDFDGEYHVVFDDAPTTHGNKVDPEEIKKNLPKAFEIIDFRVYEMRRG